MFMFLFLFYLKEASNMFVSNMPVLSFKIASKNGN